MKLTETHMELLDQLRDGPRTRTGTSPTELRELEAAGYVTTSAVNVSEVRAEITDLGKTTLDSYRMSSKKKPGD
jgi:DNA-binding PadR family transcriptional regulator